MYFSKNISFNWTFKTWAAIYTRLKKIITFKFQEDNFFITIIFDWRVLLHWKQKSISTLEMSLKMDSVARCAHHLQSSTVAGINVSDHSYGIDGWCARKAESLADSLLVVWLLWPRGPLSSDCHSWGLWDRFLQDSHSSKLTPPTKPGLPNQPLTVPFVLSDGKTGGWN